MKTTTIWTVGGMHVTIERVTRPESNSYVRLRLGDGTTAFAVELDDASDLDGIGNELFEAKAWMYRENVATEIEARS